ncbi:MAG: SpoIVB peptidase [Lachnospiraceae bacterium]|nr:SpoIVB peptidase [Lachnospiraceae bacterium]
MTRKAKYRRWLIRLLAAAVVFSCFFGWYYVNRMIPNHIHLVMGQTGEFNFQLPIDATIRTDSEEVVLGNESNIPADEIHVTLNEGFTMSSLACGNYTVSLNLFGFFPFKDIEVSVVEEGYVIPCGVPVGIYLETSGILVVGTGELTGMDGSIGEPASEIVRSGDYILGINGKPLHTKEELADAVRENRDAPAILDIRRDGETIQVKIDPMQTADGEYKIGVWIRDDMQGIGTLTYIDQNGNFGTLGHGISDSDTGLVVEALSGTLYEARVHSVIKGSTGTPGSLSGVILYGSDTEWGQIRKNTGEGVFGNVYQIPQSVSDVEWLPIGYRQDVSTGPAVVRCAVDGTIKDYEIEILRCDPSDHTNKSLVIEVTDPELLEKTGGIVQGMSGSPIIQNGRLVGAVTHVFIQNSARGYGIFLETMLEQSAR